MMKNARFFNILLRSYCFSTVSYIILLLCSFCGQVHVHHEKIITLSTAMMTVHSGGQIEINL